MRKSKIITWNQQELTVKELTVSEIATVMASTVAPTGADLVFFDRLPVQVVTLATGLERSAIEAAAPSALDALWRAVEEVNPFFVRLLDRLADRGGPAPLPNPAPK